MGPEAEAWLITPTLFAAVVKLLVDQKVRFSGSFWPSPSDRLRETSLTTEGSMSEPDFLFRFTAVAPVA